MLVNDSDAEKDPLTVIPVSNVAHGTLPLKPDGSFVYVHDGSKTTNDSFTYKISDGKSESTTATVSISIHPVGGPILARDESYTGFRGGTIVVDKDSGVLANDSHPAGEQLEAVLVDSPAHGRVDLKADGSFAYAHDGSNAPTDSFTYKATDGVQDSNVATVTLTITNRAPVAVNDSYGVKQGGTVNIAPPGVLTNDTDPDNDPLSAVLVDKPTHGTLTLNANGSFTYAHDGSKTAGDSFTYRATNATEDSLVATVIINIKTGVPGDVNLDGVVNAVDLRLVVFNFGARGVNQADLNGDGFVNLLDLIMVAFYYRP